MTPFILVSGAWGLKPFHPYYEWWRTAPWLTWMAERGFVPLDAWDPYIWSTDVTREASLAGGASLLWYVRAKNVDRPIRIIAHSLGVQPVLFASAFGLSVDVLISIGSPNREDMTDIIQLARPQIRRWLHIRTQEWDPFEWLGELGDGGWPFDRNVVPACDLVETLPRIGHSGILFDPAWFPLWETRGWLQRLRNWA